MRRVWIAILALVLVGFGSACSQSSDDGSDDAQDGGGDPTLALGEVAESVDGNVVTIPVTTENFDIVPADGDDSGATGHLHVFIDREPVDVGEVIPKEAGVVHSADNPIKLYGQTVGEHEYTVVLGDGTHTRIGEGVEESVTVEVEGPSIDGSAPATLDEGDDLEVKIEAEGVDVKAADGDDSGESGHFHVLVDPKEAPVAGEVIPEAKEGEIYHSAEDSITVEGLDKGEHIIWVVLGNGLHEAFDPPVMDKLTVTVS